VHYNPEKLDHGLAYNPFKACVVPRPIGWISTVSAKGVHNLAPYSQVQNLTFDPPYMMFAANQTSSGTRKDSVANTEETGGFVYNMATYELREAVNRSAQEVPPDVDEFELAGVTKAPSLKIQACRVAESPINLECVYQQTLRLPGRTMLGTVDVVIGRVVMVHIRDDVILPDGHVDLLKIRPLARAGYYQYTTLDSLFEMIIPGENEAILKGLEGAPQQ